MEKIKAVFKKYKEIITYILFGGLTTVVNYIIYFTCTGVLKLGWSPATVIAWVGAVAFAYVTNRIWVFESRSHGLKAVSYEIFKFVLFRLVSLGLEWLTLKLCFDLLHMNSFMYMGLAAGEFIGKTIGQVVVVAANYIFSKLLIFKKKD